VTTPAAGRHGRLSPGPLARAIRDDRQVVRPRFAPIWMLLTLQFGSEPFYW